MATKTGRSTMASILDESGESNQWDYSSMITKSEQLFTLLSVLHRSPHFVVFSFCDRLILCSSFTNTWNAFNHRVRIRCHEIRNREPSTSGTIGPFKSIRQRWQSDSMACRPQKIYVSQRLRADQEHRSQLTNHYSTSAKDPPHSSQ